MFYRTVFSGAHVVCGIMLLLCRHWKPKNTLLTSPLTDCRNPLQIQPMGNFVINPRGDASSVIDGSLDLSAVLSPDCSHLVLEDDTFGDEDLLLGGDLNNDQPDCNIGRTRSTRKKTKKRSRDDFTDSSDDDMSGNVEHSHKKRASSRRGHEKNGSGKKKQDNSSSVPKPARSTRQRTRGTTFQPTNDYEWFLYYQQEGLNSGIDLGVPKQPNSNGNICWFIVFVKLVLRQRRMSRFWRSPSNERMADENPFVQEFHDWFLNCLSSSRSKNPVPLLRKLIDTYLPEQQNTLFLGRRAQCHEPDMVFKALTGNPLVGNPPHPLNRNRPIIAPCDYFRSLQLFVNEHITIINPCCDRQREPQNVILPFLTIFHPNTQNANLSEAITRFLEDGHQEVRFCAEEDCGRQIIQQTRIEFQEAPDAIPISVQWQSNEIVELTYAETQSRRPPFKLDGNLSIQTQKDGLAHYQLMGGILHVGSIVSGHYVVFLKNQDLWYAGSDNEDFFQIPESMVEKSTLFLYTRIE